MILRTESDLINEVKERQKIKNHIRKEIINIEDPRKMLKKIEGLREQNEIEMELLDNLRDRVEQRI